ncbi:glycosyltransferase [Chitinophaga sp. SYP-B3965]|uniref:glycosyltransferase n=1 Tax=Chitinophaga sp. SYP-B3965 TaxID=2663120 RepID=UPI00129965E2|nr:glycosyltransferase [Chitinophaga sp. SYP-B3965]MRG46926.1 glycosyltransferase [Chitinophaga sp. SYP-B3965]
MELAPVILFVYNRPSHTEQTITALKANKLAADSELFIYSDAMRNPAARENVNKVRALIANIQGFKNVTVIHREVNFGLAKSVIAGVSEVIGKYGKAIVMEDDLITSTYFLTFMNQALHARQDAENIGSVSGFSFLSKEEIPAGYPHDIYYCFRHSSWGWGTWKRVWEKIDWEVKDYQQFCNSREQQRVFNQGGNDLTRMLHQQIKGEINSWSIRFDYHCARNRQFSVLPVQSLIDNIGFDGSGTHCETTDAFKVALDQSFGENLAFDVTASNKKINYLIRKKFSLTILKRIRRKLKHLFNTSL